MFLKFEMKCKITKGFLYTSIKQNQDFAVAVFYIFIQLITKS